MPRLVQSPAVGLLSVLNNKDGGIGPNALMDEYRAVIDAQGMLGLPARRQRSVSLSVVNINAALAGVPGWLRLNAQALAIAAGFRCLEGEIWRVIAFGATVTSVAGNIGITIGWDFGGAGGATDPTPLSGNSTSNVTVAGQVRGSGVQADFWAQAGQGPAVLFTTWTTGVDEATLVAHLEVESYRV